MECQIICLPLDGVYERYIINTYIILYNACHYLPSLEEKGREKLVGEGGKGHGGR